MIQPRHLVLTLVTGESPCAQRKLSWGVPLPRVAMGTHADWLVSASGVLGTHVLLSFDGHRLRAMAASDAAEVWLHGQRLPRGWSELTLPFELAFGGARVAGCAVLANTELVRAAGHSPGSSAEAGKSEAAAGASAAPPAETQLFDLSALRAAAVAPHAIVSLGSPLAATPPAPAPRARPAPPGRCPPPFEIVSGSTRVGRVSGGTARRQTQTQTGMPLAAAPPKQTEPARARPTTAPEPSLFTQTVSDHGALQNYARRLAADQHVAQAANGRRAARNTAHPALASTLLPLIAKQRALLSDRLGRVTHRQRLLALPGLVVPVLIWLSAASPSSGSNAAVTDPPAAGASHAPAPATIDPVERTPDPMDPSIMLHRAPIIAAVPPSDTAAPAQPAAPRTETNAEDSAAGHAASDAEGDDAEAQAEERVALESDAFRAAFGGNTSDGVRLYEELARTRGGETFRQAARLLEGDRVHKP